MIKTFFALLLPILITASFQYPDTKQPLELIDSSVKSRIDASLKSFVDSGKVAGVSALIFEKNKEAYFNAFGYADKEAKRVMDRNTITRIFSMTKPVTGVALMQLHEQGKFKLDDPISKYAPEFTNMQVYKGVDDSGNIILEPVKRPITIRDITRHTAGFAPGIDHPGLTSMVRKADVFNPNNSLAEMAKRLSGLPLLFHPGEQWGYGASVDVQAYLVERISGKPFDQYLIEHIFKPLGMNRTRYLVPEGERNHFAALYQRGNEGKLSAVSMGANDFNTKQWTLKPGGYGLTSTLDDYMKFARMLLNKGTLGKATILKPETVQLMATSHLSDTISQRMWLPSKGQVGFGIDFAVRMRPPASKEENNGAIGEFFWDGAASTLFWVDPVNDITAVLFVQVVPFYGQLHKRFRDAVYGEYKQQ